MERRTRIVIADDHPIIRQGFAAIIGARRDLEIVAEAATADETLSAVQRTACDVVVLDLQMPGADGLSVIKTLRERHPHLPVLILSIAPEEQFGVRAIRAGAAGFVSKRATAEQLVEAIRRVVGGGLHVSADTGRTLVDDLLRPQARRGAAAARLSDREIEVLRMLASGLSVTRIAERLDVSIKSISTYRRRLLTKLALDSTAALIRYAINNGISDS